MNHGMNVPGPLTDEYETPDWLFRALDAEFGFDLDPCATKETAKCREFYTIAEDGLVQDWSAARAFINPPYSRADAWVAAALDQHLSLAVLLLPVRTDNDWYRRLEENRRVEIRHFRKRIRFLLNGQELKTPRFTSLIAIVRGY